VSAKGTKLPQENFENKLLRCDFLASVNQKFKFPPSIVDTVIFGGVGEK
jgi:hypothetical protein